MKRILLLATMVLSMMATSFAWDFDTGEPDRASGKNRVVNAFTTGATTIKYDTLFIPGPNRTATGGAFASKLWDISSCTRVNGSVYIDFARAGSATPDTARVTPQFSKDGGLSWFTPTVCDTDAINKGDELELTADGGVSLGKLAPLVVDSSWYGTRMRLMVIFAYQGTNGTDTTDVFYRIFGVNQYKND